MKNKLEIEIYNIIQTANWSIKLNKDKNIYYK